MNKLKYFLIAITLPIFLGCVENDPEIENFPNEKVGFRYYVEGDYTLDYLVGSTIKFENTSAETGSLTWDFGDNTTPISGEENPSHKFEVAGQYKVTLSIEGVGKTTQELYVSDITPVVSLLPIEGGVCEVNKTFINMELFLPNPDNKAVEYEWTFPEGTLNENNEPVSKSTEENPGSLKFSNVGSQRIILKTKLGGRSLQDGVIDVPVGYNSEVKTLYYAVKKGNIMALKLIKDLPNGMKNNPFNLGVKSGQHPMNILFCDTSLYVLDAGKNINYIDDVNKNLGDGRIFVMSKDGNIVENMVTNNQGEAFNDPHFGYIDENAKILYYTDRNTAIRRLSLSERDLKFNPTDSKFSYFAENNNWWYYNNGLGYGAISACFTKNGDVWWWSKTYSGSSGGIFRFTNSDIGSAVKPKAGMTGSGLFIKSFVIDAQRNMVILAVRSGVTPGIYAMPIDEFPNESNDEKPQLLDKLKGYLVKELISDDEGKTSEYIDICQMTLDPDDGSVYFGFRADPLSPVKTGLMRCYPDGNTYKLETVIDGVEIYGITINNQKSKLF